MNSKRWLPCLTAFVVVLWSFIFIEAAIAETCVGTNAVGSNSAASEIRQVKSVVHGFMDLELNKFGYARESHVMYYGNLYTKNLSVNRNHFSPANDCCG